MQEDIKNLMVDVTFKMDRDDLPEFTLFVLDRARNSYDQIGVMFHIIEDDDTISDTERDTILREMQEEILVLARYVEQYRELSRAIAG